MGGHGWGNGQLEHNTGRPENAALDGEGRLAIVARRESFGGNRYTSARIKTQGLFEATYGRFEARIQLPEGQGIWPAFWLLGADIDSAGWPACGEIDVMEFRGQHPAVVAGTVHGPGYSGGGGLGTEAAIVGGLAGRFRLFAVDWQPQRIRWFVDDFQFHEVTPADLPTGADWVFDHPFFIILNVAVGGWFAGDPDASTPFPQRMLVDYVRVYQRAQAIEPRTPLPDGARRPDPLPPEGGLRPRRLRQQPPRRGDRGHDHRPQPGPGHEPRPRGPPRRPAPPDRRPHRSPHGLHHRPHPVAVGAAAALDLRPGPSAPACSSSCCGRLPRGQSEGFYFVYFLAGSLLFYLGYTIFATPWVALGYELTPDYHERTRLMGVQNFIGQLAYVVTPWFLWVMQYEPLFDDLVSGAAGLSVAIGLFTIAIGVLPAIFLRERYKEVAAAEADAGGAGFRHSMEQFFSGFLATLRFRPFLKLCAATFLVFNGFILVSSFQAYVIIYYVFSGDQSLGARYAGWSGTLAAASTFVVISLVTWLGTRIGKRQTFYLCIGISILGYGLKWICYDPAHPLLLLLPTPFIAFGLGCLFTVMPSMIADVCDLDELETHERREGMFGSIFWWVVKLGMALALAGGGVLLNATGFDVDLGGAQTARTIFLMRLFDVIVPMVSSALAIWAIATHTLTEEKAYQVRRQLEERRGVLAAG